MPNTLQREFRLDATDGKLLHHLQQHGRLSFAELARRVRLTTPAVIERVRKLEDAGIILGYHAEVSAAKMGLPVLALIPAVKPLPVKRLRLPAKAPAPESKLSAGART